MPENLPGTRAELQPAPVIEALDQLRGNKAAELIETLRGLWKNKVATPILLPLVLAACEATAAPAQSIEPSRSPYVPKPSPSNSATDVLKPTPTLSPTEKPSPKNTATPGQQTPDGNETAPPKPTLKDALNKVLDPNSPTEFSITEAWFKVGSEAMRNGLSDALVGESGRYEFATRVLGGIDLGPQNDRLIILLQSKSGKSVLARVKLGDPVWLYKTKLKHIEWPNENPNQAYPDVLSQSAINGPLNNSAVVLTIPHDPAIFRTGTPPYKETERLAQSADSLADYDQLLSDQEPSDIQHELSFICDSQEELENFLNPTQEQAANDPWAYEMLLRST